MFNPYQTLVVAIDKSQSGDTIIVNKGLYSAKDIRLLYISKNLKIIGNGPDVIFSCHSSYPEAGWFISSSIYISKIIINNCQLAIFGAAKSSLFLSSMSFNRCNRAVDAQGSLYINSSYFNLVSNAVFIGNEEKKVIENSVFQSVYLAINNLQYDGTRTSLVELNNNTFHSDLGTSPMILKNLTSIEMRYNKFINGSACAFDNVKHITLEGNSFNLCNGLYVVNSSLKIQGGNFSNGIDMYGNGSALSLYASTFTIADSTFFKNRAKYGGAIYCNGGFGSVFTSSFITNNAISDGGAYYCDNGCQILFNGDTFNANFPVWSSNDCGNL